MMKRLLIANRGEIAIRIIRACREMGIESVAIYSEADASAPHVAAADRAVPIGRSPAVESYLSVPRIMEAVRSSGADAVHPGNGFLSENAAFATACLEAGIVFVGPPPEAMTRMGSKIGARRLVAAAGVPVVPGDTPHDQSDDGVRRAVERVGIPVLIKASAGGGGKGMRSVRVHGELTDSIQAARREALAAFGDGTLYVERLLDRPRHVEVQVFADTHGHVVHLFERDCSVQRRHQKVIEESPAPALTAETRTRITEAAIAVARAVGYQNAGTIEFLVDDPTFYFLEMNTRLQVEHPVTEQATGLDLVRAQLIVAAGEPLPWTQTQICRRGHAIEARVYAEDPAHGFLPQAGRLETYREPHWPGIRIDSGVAEGGEIPVYYDPMIAKVIATAESRDLAIAKLAAALRRFVVEGVRTNIPFLLRVLEREEFRNGEVDTGFLDREGEGIAQSSVAGRQSSVSSHQSSISNQQFAISNEHVAARNLRYDPWRPGARAISAAPSTSTRRAASTSGEGAIVAPMPATVIKLPVRLGDAVKKGDLLVLLEAMKMELPIRALGDATVGAIRCREGELVQADEVLLELIA
jgi:3-methylcrotonyl-CoA carboxylase alpha subunit